MRGEPAPLFLPLAISESVGLDDDFRMSNDNQVKNEVNRS
jgi:hypothetical protein